MGHHRIGAYFQRQSSGYESGSPWSNQGGPLAYTRRSTYKGAQYNALYWKYLTGANVSPVIASDGTIYIGSGNYLFAKSPGGTLKWQYLTGSSVFSTPAIGADGTVYVGSTDNYLYSISPAGSLNWRYLTGGLLISSPSIGSDGSANHLHWLLRSLPLCHIIYWCTGLALPHW